MPNPTTPPNSNAWESDKSGQKSWGDLWKESLHWWATDIGVNYITNATISVGLTYLFEKTKGEAYKQWLDKKLEKVENPTTKAVTAFIVKFLTKSQILLMGGHFLVPLMKDFNDNRHRQTEWMGDRIDALQEMFGQGNEASKKNRSDYAALHKILQEKPKDVSPEQANILIKYGVNSSFDFIEEKRTWKEVVLSRLRAMGFSAATNAVIGGLEGKTTQKDAAGKEIEHSGIYSRAWANPVSKGKGFFPGLGKVFAKIPGFKKVFPDTELFAREYANDMILTAASTIGFAQGMKAAEKNGPSHEEMRARNEAYWTNKVASKAPEGDRQFLAENGIRPSDADDIAALKAAGANTPTPATFAENASKFDSRAQLVTEGRESGTEQPVATR